MIHVYTHTGGMNSAVAILVRSEQGLWVIRIDFAQAGAMLDSWCLPHMCEASEDQSLTLYCNGLLRQKWVCVAPGVPGTLANANALASTLVNAWNARAAGKQFQHPDSHLHVLLEAAAEKIGLVDFIQALQAGIARPKAARRQLDSFAVA